MGIEFFNVDIYTQAMRAEPINIIIIDDEPDLCFLLSAMLAKYGYHVTYYHTLRSGVDAAITQKPHWVIVDNNLPDGLGWEGANEILQVHESTHLVKISANPDSPRTDNRYNVHYLIKPIKAQAIVDLIEANAE